jgi:predicted AAA+ superfamily ATPase
VKEVVFFDTGDTETTALGLLHSIIPNLLNYPIKLYLSILEDTFMLRQLMPWHANVSKRLVKSPKMYLRDSGIFHALQSIEDQKALRRHPN